MSHRQQAAAAADGGGSSSGSNNHSDGAHSDGYQSSDSIDHPSPHIDYSERVMKDVPAPLWDYLPRSDLFDRDGKPNTEKLKQHMIKEGRVDPNDAIDLINMAAQRFKTEPNLLQLNDPITVCGDIHGQYFDLVELFRIGGEPSKDVKYLFLGDYVDRGNFGTEVCFLLLSYKIRFPNSFFMIRGNHECRHLTAYFNFKQECLYKYNMDVYTAFMECFDCLPLGALLNSRFLCVHGGLSPDIRTIDDINQIDRFKEPPSNGAFCDLLWSDPMDEDEEEANPDATYMSNELRGCSYVFSYNAVSKFLRANNLLSVIRAHEAQDEGYKLYKKGPTGFPTCICLFSAPNYCGVYNNKGAIIRFQNNLMNIRQFNCSPHPYYLPNFMNAFNWSLPFVVEKVLDMSQVILNLCDSAEDEEDEDTTAPKPLIGRERADTIKTKIRSVGRISRMFATLRQEHENILFLKGLAGGQIPQGLLTQGSEAIRNAVLDFKTAKRLDRPNEKVPPGERPLSRSDSFSDPLKKKTILEQRSHKISPLTAPAEKEKVAIKIEKINE